MRRRSLLRRPDRERPPSSESAGILTLGSTRTALYAAPVAHFPRRPAETDPKGRFGPIAEPITALLLTSVRGNKSKIRPPTSTGDLGLDRWGDAIQSKTPGASRASPTHPAGSRGS